MDPIQHHAALNPFLGEAAPVPFRDEFTALARERDPEMYFEGMLALAGRLEQRGEQSAASRIYATLLSPHPHPLPVGERGSSFSARDLFPSPLRGEGQGEGSAASAQVRARQRLDALTGIGAVGPRAEFLLRQLSREVLDPAPLAGMFAASAAFRLTRLTALSRMVSPWRAHALAFGAEAIAFPLGTRLTATALGRELDWNPDMMGREFASSFIVLGAMRLSGTVGWGLTQRLGMGGASRTLPGMVRQGAMFGGILVGHRMEEAVGIRPQQAGATTLIDSLALLLQFNIAGRLVHGLGGTRLQNWERGLDTYAETLRTPAPTPSYLWQPAFALAAPGARAANFLTLMLMKAEGSGSGGRGAPHPEIERLVRELSPPPRPSEGALDPGHEEIFQTFLERAGRGILSREQTLLRLLHTLRFDWEARLRANGARIQFYSLERLMRDWESQFPFPPWLQEFRRGEQGRLHQVTEIIIDDRARELSAQQGDDIAVTSLSYEMALHGLIAKHLQLPENTFCTRYEGGFTVRIPPITFLLAAPRYLHGPRGMKTELTPAISSEAEIREMLDRDTRPTVISNRYLPLHGEAKLHPYVAWEHDMYHLLDMNGLGPETRSELGPIYDSLGGLSSTREGEAELLQNTRERVLEGNLAQGDHLELFVHLRFSGPSRDFLNQAGRRLHSTLSSLPRGPALLRLLRENLKFPE